MNCPKKFGGCHNKQCIMNGCQLRDHKTLAPKTEFQFFIERLQYELKYASSDHIDLPTILRIAEEAQDKFARQ